MEEARIKKMIRVDVTKIKLNTRCLFSIGTRDWIRETTIYYVKQLKIFVENCFVNY